MQGSIKKIKKWNDTLIPLAVGSLTVLSAGWAADAISTSVSALVSKNPVRFDGLNAFYIFLFFVMVFFCIPWLKNRYYWPRLRRRMIKAVTAEKRRHLVVFLSPANMPDWLTLSSDIHKDIEYLAQNKALDHTKRWQWEMPLRAIAFHSDGAKLESITMICSKKTIKHVHAFREVLSNYKNVLGNTVLNLMVKQDNQIRSVSINGRPEQPIDYIEDNGLDFEDFEEMVEAFKELMLDFSKQGIREKDIVIDITGGQKPNSVVGAVVTFNRRIKAQYVQTEGDNAIIQYDVVQDTGDAGGGLGID